MTRDAPGWRLLIAPRAHTVLKRLPAPERKRFLEAFDRLAADPSSAPAKPLQGRPEWRLRVGGWRALLRVDREAGTIVVVAIGPRGDIYKGPKGPRR
ncbi:MAG TPA: type II toxin-antitoxin system RelE/ParE family toxin [Thermaerobacter sp.]